MKTVVTGGIVLGLLVGLWTFVMGFTGWYRDPALQALFWVVILFQIGVLVWALGKTAAEGHGYLRQVGNGSLLSIIAGLIVIPSSLLFTTVVFPDYFQDLQAMQAELLASRGLTAEEIEAAQALSAKMQTPGVNAVLGFIGTTVTGIVVSLITAIFRRARS